MQELHTVGNVEGHSKTNGQPKRIRGVSVFSNHNIQRTLRSELHNQSKWLKRDTVEYGQIQMIQLRHHLGLLLKAQVQFVDGSWATQGVFIIELILEHFDRHSDSSPDCLEHRRVPTLTQHLTELDLTKIDDIGHRRKCEFGG